MFSQASEYALRALTELARYPAGEWVLVTQIADPLAIPVHYLAKVLQTLARRGVLESQRGRQGGFRLAKPAWDITAYDVVRELDDVRSLESCVMGEGECSDATACPLHSLWKNIRQRFVTALETTTLKDLAEFQEHRPDSVRLPAIKTRGAGADARRRRGFGPPETG
ncbi:MAG: RrF2 family transcriptional regulator [Planctomycetes bacterium]|nr:RrF2 family transcriptional regulator [Planctomycetota bacterium]